MSKPDTRFRRVLSRVAEGWRAGAAPAEPTDSSAADRLTWQPDDVEVHRGGGVEIQRPPGVRRSDSD